MSNSASRLLDLVAALNNHDPSKAAMEHWFKALGYGVLGPEEDAIAAMQAAVAEVRLVDAHLEELGAPPDLFSTASTQLREAFSPARSAAAYKDVAMPLMQGTVLNPLAWASWVIRDFNSPDIAGPELEALVASVDEQEKLLKGGGLSLPIRRLLERQIRELRIALRLYTVKGAAAVQDACAHGVASFLKMSPQDVKDATPEDQAAIKGSASVLKQAAEAAQSATAIINLLEKAASASSSAIAWAQGFLPS